MSGSTTAVIVIPVVIFVLILVWIGLSIYADSRPPGGRGEAAHRGETTGGIVHGDARQMTRRDEAPREDTGGEEVWDRKPADHGQ